MTAFTRHTIRFTQTQRLGIFAFLLLIVGLELSGFFIFQKQMGQVEIPEIFSETNTENLFSDSGEAFQLQNFDPNSLTNEEWMKLGFSEKQVNTIIKYKYSLGGYFSNKQQIKDCFVISAKKFNEIEAFIVFGKFENYKNQDQTFGDSESKTKINYHRFNPNEYTQKDWQNIGFSEKQAASILKYKTSLGGSFSSLTQIQDCFMISPEKFREMRPFIVLNTGKTGNSDKKVQKSQATIRLIEQDSSKINGPVIRLLED